MRLATMRVQFLLSRCFSSSATSTNNIKKSVYISQSHDIYTNLALEDWLYRHYDFTDHNIMMLWCNNPCVVIGRHQNPWLEANVGNLNHIQLARRNSGGGTVYHDKGNLNITFFTARNQYNRKHNLELISRAVFKKYSLKIDISPREDLVINEAKVSGTAAKLGQPSAYHHCTLLVDVDKIDLSIALHKSESGIKTNATQSVRSKIVNLNQINSDITISGLMAAIGTEYMQTLVDDFQLIDPNEQSYPGITEICDSLKDWEWCYGKTPKFTVTKSFVIPSKFLNNFHSANCDNLKVTMNVEQGRINDVILYIPPGLSSTGFTGEVKVVTNLTGCKFTEDAINSLECSLGSNEYGLMEVKEEFVRDCVRQVMSSV